MQLRTTAIKRRVCRVRRFFQTVNGHEIGLSIFAIVTLVTLGTIGFVVLEGWSAFDSLYMTAITLSTVGFMEVHPLSPAGRGFTIFLIFVGVGVAMGVFTLLSRFVIEQQINWLGEKRKMQNAIDVLRDHVIFCGFGRLSSIAAQELARSNTPLVIVDKDPEKVELARLRGYFAVHGDASTDEVLLQAGVDRAKRLVSLLPSDADNLYVILTGKELNPSLYIISRSEDEIGERRLRRAGASRIIAPYRVGGMKIAEGLLRPNVTEFLEIASSSGATELEIEELLIPERSVLHGKSLKDSGIRQKTNIIIAALIPPSGAMIFNPSGETIIEGGSTLIGMGIKNDFKELEQLLSA